MGGRSLATKSLIYILSAILAFGLILTQCHHTHSYAAQAIDGQAQKTIKTVTGDTAVVPPDAVIKQAENLDEVTDDRFFASLANAVGQSSGAGVLAIVGLIAQLLIQFTKTPMFGQIFRKVDGRGKLTIVCAMTCITTYVGLRSEGMGGIAALTSGGFMSVAMVAGHQLYKQFVKDQRQEKVG